MKKKLMLLLLSPVVLSVAGCGNSSVASKGSIDVVIISGQSNGVGCSWCNQILGSMGADKYSEYQQGYSEIQIAYDCWTKAWPAGGVDFYSQNKSNGFVPVKLGQGNGTHSFGPEIGISDELHEKYANKLALIKFACGASCLKEDWLERDSEMYPKFIAYIKEQMNELKNMGYNPTIKAFCWMQGESDAANQGFYKQYKANLRTFVTNVRTDLKDLGESTHDIPFIDAGISSYKDWVYYAQVNKQKAEFAAESEYNFYIDSLAEGLHTHLEPVGAVDGAHWDSDSQVKLGRLFAQTFEQFLAK